MHPLWAPSPERIAAANITAFEAVVRRRFEAELAAAGTLYNWSVAHPEQFWALLLDFVGVKTHARWTQVLSNRDSMLEARWFEGATLNFAENLLRHRDQHLAIIFRNETGERRTLTYAELYDAVARLSAQLRKMGVGKGDRVAAYLPNLPETIIAMLATTSIGAIWSSCSPDFGIKGVVERFEQISPRVLLTVDGYQYNGKVIDCCGRLPEILQGIGSIEQVIIVPYAKSTFGKKDLAELALAKPIYLYPDLITAPPSEAIHFETLPFNHPIYILFSSGTTGAPKCIVHGAGGTLLQHLKDLVLQTDLKREDRIFYFTTCGWMMWNWLVSSLAVGATVLLYEGSPFFPNGNVLFDFADAEGMTIFGTSARYISALKQAGLEPKKTHRLNTLKTMLSTGSPLLPEHFDYVYDSIKTDLCLSSISGGTDIVSCFVLGNPTLPVYRGEIQSRGLGMKVEVYNEKGESVIGEPGELVCTRPFPSQPVYFWGDPKKERYRSAYFGTYENVWRHGDWAMITARGGVVISGRSDAVLNPGGVRIGTAEIYRTLESIEQIAEGLAVGQRWEGDERVILFVKMKPGVILDASLQERIRKTIRNSLTPRHVPSKIIAAPDIPRTINGKVTELAVKNIIHGLPVKNSEALINPEALSFFENLSELKCA